MRLVLCNGVFDLLHPGHIAHLREAKSMGDYLVVGLTMDEYVGKPGRPIQTYEERAEVLRELRCVAAVSACRNAVDAILKWKPYVFVKGGDYEQKGLLKEEIEACRQVDARIAHTHYVPVTTTDIVKRIKACA
jgi:rfaE bifunctional protein nucleotidyltransferase chain/domain